MPRASIPRARSARVWQAISAHRSRGSKRVAFSQQRRGALWCTAGRASRSRAPPTPVERLAAMPDQHRPTRRRAWSAARPERIGGGLGREEILEQQRVAAAVAARASARGATAYGRAEVGEHRMAVASFTKRPGIVPSPLT